MKFKLMMGALVFTSLVGCGQGEDEVLNGDSSSVSAITPSATPAPFDTEGFVSGQAVQVRQNAAGGCLSSVDVTFSKPVIYSTLLGKVLIRADLSARKAMIPHSTADERVYRFTLPPATRCPQQDRYRQVVVTEGVRGLDGDELKGESVYALGATTATSQARWNGTRRAACVGSRCFRVDPRNLNTAMRSLESWMSTESSQGMYRAGGLQTLPMGEGLTSYSEVNRRNHFANGDTIYVLRRAGRFLRTVLPGVPQIAVGDLSAPDGGTPRTQFGTETIFTHPEGSHSQGKDADVTYIGMEKGGAGLNWEANFWLTYAILQSTGVDMVITAHRAELIEWARAAHQLGLINRLALGRFNKLMDDQGMNHDKHLHVSVRNAINNYGSIKFTPADDVYNCYLALNPAYRGGDSNFCR